MTNKINLIKKTIENLPKAIHNKRLYFYDTKVQSLGVAVTSKGTKTFFVYKKINGRPERVTLGRYPDLSVENARKHALNAITQIAHGKNLNQEKKKTKGEVCFFQLFIGYM